MLGRLTWKLLIWLEDLCDSIWGKDLSQGFHVSKEEENAQKIHVQTVNL